MHSTEDVAMPEFNIVLAPHGDSHVEKHEPCDDPVNKPEAFLLSHMLTGAHGVHTLQHNCMHTCVQK